MLKRPSLAVLAAAALVGPTVLVGVASPAAAATTCNVFFDVNKDGHSDVPIGSPGEGVKVDGVKAGDAGTVTIAYGDDSGEVTGYDGRSISLTDLELTPKAGDRFGASLLIADLNGDSCGDLVVGAPGNASGAGMVVVVYGMPPTTGQWGDLVQVLRQGSGGAPGSPEAGDAFGSTLAVTGSNASGNPTQLWVGAPLEDLSVPGPNPKDAGLVVVYPTAPNAILPSTGITTLQQGSGGVTGAPESGDKFGNALAGSTTTVLVGVPGEDVGSLKDAGMFHAFVNGVSSGWTQKTVGVPGTAEAGDRLGRSVAVLPSCKPGAEAWAVGAPYEDIGKTKDAGIVSLMDRGTATAITLQQGSAGIQDTPEASDLFGERLLTTPPTASHPNTSFLVVGTPHENVGSAADAGSVTTLTTTCPSDVLAVSSPTTWTQQSGTMANAAATNDNFGAALGVALLLEGAPGGTIHLRLLVGVPGEDELDNGVIDSGMVAILPSSATGFTDVGNLLIGQETGDSPGMPGTGEGGDGFGGALDAGNASR